MKRSNLLVALVALACAIASLSLAGCSEPGNEPVKDGKTVTNDRAAMEKMYKNNRPAGGAPAPQ